MCLITTQQEPLVAEQDIRVYKSVTVKLRPIFLYGNIQYEYGKLNETTIEKSNNWCSFDDEDLTWINNHVRVENIDSPKQSKTIKCFGQGFHSCLSKEKAFKTKQTYGGLVVECLIPKGSTYYTNPVGLVISDKIIILKQIS